MILLILYDLLLYYKVHTTKVKAKKWGDLKVYWTLSHPL